MRSFSVLTALGLLAPSLPLQAQQPLRIFTEADGSGQFTGRVLALNEELVTVEREDGQRFTIARASLSVADQLWLEQLDELAGPYRYGARQTAESPESTANDEARAEVAAEDAAAAAIAAEEVAAAEEAQQVAAAAAAAAAARRDAAAQVRAEIVLNDPLLGISPTARALLTGYGEAARAGSARASVRRGGLQVYTEVPLSSYWGGYPGWGWASFSTSPHHHRAPRSHWHVDWHGDHVHLHGGGWGHHHGGHAGHSHGGHHHGDHHH